VQHEDLLSPKVILVDHDGGANRSYPGGCHPYLSFAAPSIVIPVAELCVDLDHRAAVRDYPPFDDPNKGDFAEGATGV
jgi:hypothetical protein